MAKKKKCNFTLTKILGVVSLVLSVLMIVSFFMPSYTSKLGDTTTTINGVTMIKGATMSDEEYVKYLANSDNTSEQKAAITSAYVKYNDEEGNAYKVSVWLNLVVLIAGVALAGVSVVTILTGKVGLLQLITGLVGVVLGLVLICLAGGTAKHFTTTLTTVSIGVGIWFGLFTPILSLGSLVTAKLLGKK